MNAFLFNIDKAVAASGYVAKKNGGRITTFEMLKILYAGERIALKTWHRPITGDSFVSMHKGVVLSRIYDLIKGAVLKTNSDMVKWSEHFAPRLGNEVRLVSDPEFDYLSDREREALDRGFAEIKALIRKHGLIADVLHKNWPEWKDPGNGSIPITLEDVLGDDVGSEKDLQQIESELQAVLDAKAALQV